MIVQMNISAMIGAVAILEEPMHIPPLIRKCAHIFSVNKCEDQMNGLDAIHTVAFYNGAVPSSIDQGEWKEQWWNELPTASFPQSDVSNFISLHELLAIRFAVYST